MHARQPSELAALRGSRGAAHACSMKATARASVPLPAVARRGAGTASGARAARRESIGIRCFFFVRRIVCVSTVSFNRPNFIFFAGSPLSLFFHRGPARLAPARADRGSPHRSLSAASSASALERGEGGREDTENTCQQRNDAAQERRRRRRRGPRRRRRRRQGQRGARGRAAGGQLRAGKAAEERRERGREGRKEREDSDRGGSSLSPPAQPLSSLPKKKKNQNSSRPSAPSPSSAPRPSSRSPTPRSSIMLWSGSLARKWWTRSSCSPARTPGR